jgi:hypothetical protein
MAEENCVPNRSRNAVSSASGKGRVGPLAWVASMGRAAFMFVSVNNPIFNQGSAHG